MKTGYDRKEQIEMSEYGYIVKMKCLTNMHVGDGEENYSIIDKMVERDPVTNCERIWCKRSAARVLSEKISKSNLRYK